MFKKKFILFLFISLCVAVLSCAHTPRATLSPAAYKKRNLYAHIQGTIVIDAGHGGKDSGAIGPSGLSEKVLTLDISKRIKRLINLLAPNINVVLTREKDEYVSLKQRIDKANKAKADLFISVHINSSEIADSKGFEVYSLDVASDKHAEKLAAKENKSFSSDKGDVGFILADLRANSNRKESDKLATWILKGIGTQMNKLDSSIKPSERGYNQALFYVLFVKAPSVLTELFFISNPKEERRLRNAGFREACARGISMGIFQYLETKNLRAKK